MRSFDGGTVLLHFAQYFVSFDILFLIKVKNENENKSKKELKI
jgi:hypothetical protein